MPRELPLEGRREWRRVIDALDEMGTAHVVDRALLYRYCQAWADWHRVNEQLQGMSMLVRGQKGNAVRNPLWLLRRDTERALNEMAAQLGISPSSRLRNGIKHERAQDEELSEGRSHYLRLIKSG